MLLSLTSIRLTAPVVVCLSRAAWRSVKSSRADAVAGRPHRRDARGFAITKTRRGILMAARTLPGGTFTMAEDLTVTRMGYGAMQLAGPHVFGPPADRDAAVAVLREAMELGITHIDTSDFYGPHVTNQIIKEALHPYPDSLHIVTKVRHGLTSWAGEWPGPNADRPLGAGGGAAHGLRAGVVDVG